MKKLLFVFFVIISLFSIYVFTVDKKVYYLSLGDFDSFYVKDYLYEKGVLEKYVHYSFDNIPDIFEKIDSNYKYIKNDLIKADLITIKFDLYEVDDLDKLFDTIRYYSKEKIIFIGLDSNDIVEGICRKHNVDYINFVDNKYVSMKIIEALKK